MTSIIYIGMDVHTTNFTLCAFDREENRFFAETDMKPDYLLVLKYLSRLKKKLGREVDFICGYEAGYLGYSLYHDLKDHGVKCVILAPSTMADTVRNGVKTDRRDARKISTCLAYNLYSSVFVPTEADNAVKEYIRMRDDVKMALKRYKQQLLAFCTRMGKRFDGASYWTQKHLRWLHSLKFDHELLQETFDEYYTLYQQAEAKVAMLDKRIEQLALADEYRENVRKLCCFIGISTHAALSLIVEVGDFKRFSKAQKFSSFLGLVPGEKSSGNSIQRTGITKAGNSHLRRLLTEAAQGYTHGKVGYKSKLLIAKQAGNEAKVIAYADRANERLKSKFYKMMFHSRRNVAISAVARELSCFIWGMMTGNIS